MKVAKIETRDWFTCAQAGKRLNLSADTIRRYIHNAREGITPAMDGMKIGHDWLVHKDEIARYKKERKGRGRQPSAA